MNGLRRAHGGFTLIELMIAITIGLVVIGVASSVLQQTIRGNLKIKDSTMMQESAFFTSHIVGQHLRQTGFKNVDSSLISGRRIPILRNEEIFPKVDGVWLEGQYLKADAASISIRFQGSSDSTGTADGSIIDCGGSAIASDTVSDVSIFLVDGNLICSSDGAQYTLTGSDDTLSVETLIISLGIDVGDDGSIDRYVDSAVATSAELSATREVLLRILLVSNTQFDALNRTYKFNNTELDYPDNRYRREVIIRTMIRNATDIS